MKPLIILHGWSDQASSFEGLAQFFQNELDRDIHTIKLADWLSMNDEITYRDLAEAMQREWNRLKLPKTKGSADIVIHSTGALVVREWLTEFYQAGDNPVDHILMLAPANFGSPLAHKGKAFYGRIIKGWRTGLQTGKILLNGLEVGSPYSWELAERDLLSGKYWYGKHRIKATVLVGNEGYDGVRAAANEDGSDGTVRISTANLNAVKMSIDLSKPGEKPTELIRGMPAGHRIAFGILNGDDHGSIIMKRANTPKNSKAKQYFIRSLTVTADEWEPWCDELDEVRQQFENVSYRTNSDKHTFQNTVVRVIDDIGNPVEDYFIEFYQHDADRSWLGKIFHRDVLKKVHKPGVGANYRSMYIDVTELHHLIDKEKTDHLKVSVHAEPSVEDDDNAQPSAGYAKTSAEVILSPSKVRQIFAANRTLLIEIIIKREIPNVFRISDHN